MNNLSDKSTLAEIVEYLKRQDQRLTAVENALHIEPQPENTVAVMEQSAAPETVEEISQVEEEEQLENRIGQFWFAKTGIIVLAIGIGFLLTFPYENLPSFLPSLFGYFLAFAIGAISIYMRKNYEFIAGYFLGGGLVLLYFTTLRLYFFSQQQTVSDTGLEVGLLSFVVLLCFFVSLKQRSIYLTGISITLGLATALISDSAIIILLYETVFAVTAVVISLKFKWFNLVLYTAVFTYLTHLLWFLNNPFVGRPLAFNSLPEINLLFLLLYVVVFSLGVFLREAESSESFEEIISSVGNSTVGYGLFLLITLTQNSPFNPLFHFLAFLVFIILSTFFWTKRRSKYSTFFYVMTAYLALSVAIVLQFQIPDYFIWLCWQSIVVVSTAVWFRSKFIIVANFGIYLAIFFAFLAFGGKVDLVSISFGLVALISARILNWKKERLELKTEQMRNAYLLTALFVIPYALYNAVPSGFVSISWIAVSILYYVFSLLLKIEKYRWMSLATLLLTVVYVFIIGITSSDWLYKIVSFIVLGIVLLTLSIIYSKKKSSKHA
ncbi:MAG: DUF2339 domain-containing protein [Ignavibacteriaceae bacterium]|nr:DUF2339 domain-containing protein [Ignavibacteriaceae bacterium]